MQCRNRKLFQVNSRLNKREMSILLEFFEPTFIENERNHSVMYAVCRIQCELRLGRLRNYNVERKYQLRTIQFQQMKMRKYIPCVRVE